MPPALSEDERSDDGFDIDVPERERRGSSRSFKEEEEEYDEGMDNVVGDVKENEAATPGEDEAGADEEDEEGEDEEEEEDVYVVEKIQDHSVDESGNLTFRVKWEGYDKKADETWEPEENLLDGAPDIVEAYYKKIGSREKIIEDSAKARSSKKRNRQGGSTPSGGPKRARKNGSHPANGTPPASAKANAWKPPSGSWEDDIETIDACEDEETGKLIVFLNWKNGHKTKHGTDVIYKRCPQKMLQFYERHIRIIKNPPPMD